MALDNIQAIDRDSSIKKETKGTIYSIKLKQKTLEKAKELMEKRETLIQQLNANVADGVQRGDTTEQLVGQNIVAAANIEKLEKKINILGMIQGPLEERGTRKIRLIGKMIKEAKAKSDAIYAVNEEEEKLEVSETTPVVVEVPAVNVQQIAANAGQAIGQSIETAISGQSLGENHINEVPGAVLGISPAQVASVVTEPVVSVPVQNQPLPVSSAPVEVTPVAPVVEQVAPVVTEPVVSVPVQNQPLPVSSVPVEVTPVAPVVEQISVATEPITEVDLEEQNRINNETMKNYVGENIMNNTENEYIPMTEEEVAESQRKLVETAARSEEARHQRIMEEEARKAKEVETINESKGFDFVSVPAINAKQEIPTEPEKSLKLEEPLRDDILIAPEREIKTEEKTDKTVDVQVEKPLLVEAKEKEKPRLKNMSASEKKEIIVSHRDESIEELAALIKEEQQKQEEKQREKEKRAAELKGLKEDYDKLIENEKFAEERLEDLKKQEEKKDKELEEKKAELRKRLETMQNHTESIDADIQKYIEEFDSIKEDGDKRNDRLEHLISEAEDVQKTISDIDEMLEKFGSVGEDTTGFQKII